jgi:hypothetical protein
MSAGAACQSTDKSVCATWILPYSHDADAGESGVAQTLLSVLVQLGTPEQINAVFVTRYFFFFGRAAAIDSVTFARNSFAAASSSGSVIFGRSASIIASASVNLPSLALLTAS